MSGLELMEVKSGERNINYSCFFYNFDDQVPETLKNNDFLCRIMETVKILTFSRKENQEIQKNVARRFSRRNTCEGSYFW